MPDLTWNLLHLALVCACFGAGAVLATAGKSKPFPDVPPRLALLIVVAVMLAALGIRLYGIDFGLPAPYHPDEHRKAHLLRRMMAEGSLVPERTLHPPLLMYLSWLMSSGIEACGVFASDVIARHILAGRLVSAISGSLSVIFVYLIGRELSSRATGALAALIFAFSPLHVTSSRYFKEDILFVTFLLWCTYYCLLAARTKQSRHVFLAGLLAGISFGSKYTGLLSLAAVAGIPWASRERAGLRPERALVKPVLAAVFLMPVGFLLTTPYLFADPGRVWSLYDGFRAESSHAMRGHFGVAIDAWSQLWMFHLSRSVIPGLGLPVVAAALVACGMLARRAHPRWLLLLFLMLLFYCSAEWARSKPPPQPDRYILPCIPFFALFAAQSLTFLFASLYFKLGAVRALISSAAVTALVLCYPLFKTVTLAGELRPDTRQIMTGWLASSLPEGTKIVVMGGSVYLPRVPQKLVAKTMRRVVGREKKEVAKKLRESGFDYLLTSNFRSERFSVQHPKRKEVREAVESIRKSFPLVKEIAPKYGSYGFHNPVLRLYALKDVGAPQ